MFQLWLKIWLKISLMVVCILAELSCDVVTDQAKTSEATTSETTTSKTTASDGDLETSSKYHPPKSEKAISEIYSFHLDEINYLKSFHIRNLESLSAQQKLPFPNFKQQATELGKALFFDSRLSRNNKISCATCHDPARFFMDGKAVSEGIKVLERNSPSLLGVGFSPWLYWDGRKDSLWSQALAPIEHPKEMGNDRLSTIQYVLAQYTKEYQKIVGALTTLDQQIINLPFTASPLGTLEEKDRWQNRLTAEQQERINHHFIQIGYFLMAYEQDLKPTQAIFDEFVDHLSQGSDVQTLQNIMGIDAVLGLRLFMGKANCAGCHNGPLFTNFEFHNIGVPERDESSVDLGRFAGAKRLSIDEFNCLLSQGAAAALDNGSCEEIVFLKTKGKELIGAFKTPSLRNVGETAPYMHSGQFGSLQAVISHYNKPKPPFFDPVQHPEKPHFDIFPLGLNESEERHLLAFLHSLTSKF